MIKKIFKALLVLGLAILPFNFSHAELINGGNNAYLVLNNGSMGDFYGTNFFTNNTYTLTNNGNGNFTFTDGESYQNIRQIRTINRNGGYMYYFWHDGKLTYHKSIGGAYGATTVVVSGFAKTTLSDFTGAILTESNFTYSLPDELNVDTLVFGYYKHNNDPFSIWNYNVFCLGNSTNIYCSRCSAQDTNSDAKCFGGQTPIDLGLTHGSQLTDIVELGLVGSSPFISAPSNTPVNYGTGLDGYDYIEIGSGDLIDYFENTPSYKFNMNICYIGTTDLSSVYENAIPYYEGTGYTIFDFYSKLYNTTGFSIKQVGAFVNTRYINFSTWFMGENRSAISGVPLYNAYYSFGSGFWLDQGSGLVNPFVGNLSAYYFMGSNVYQDGRITTPGEEIATYCYKKLYVEKGSPSNDGSSYNITDNHDSSYDQNANSYIVRLKNTTSYFSGLNTIVSQSWTGTPLDYYDNGESITDFGGFFSSAFNKFRDSFPDLPPSAFGVGFLPLYISLFLMAICFFRFLSH